MFPKQGFGRSLPPGVLRESQPTPTEGCCVTLLCSGFVPSPADGHVPSHDMGWMGYRFPNEEFIQKSRSRCRGWAEDSVYHYGRGRIFWDFASRLRPRGLGLTRTARSADAFICTEPARDDDKVRMALGINALHKAVKHLRHNPLSKAQPHQLLQTFVLKGAVGSKSQALLKADTHQI